MSNLPMEIETKAPYSSDAVANAFLLDRLHTIDPMKIQKLVYYSHAWHLAAFDAPLVKESCEAWPYGPVFPMLYDEFSSYGHKRIDRLAVRQTVYDETGELVLVAPKISDDDERARFIINYVWNSLGSKLSGVQLSNLTHRPEEPWAKVRKHRKGVVIPDKMIAECFKRLMTNGRN